MKQTECDVLVVGGGSAGFAAAVTAAHHGQKVILIEKAHVFGGASCWSGGWLWVPRNALAKAAGINEDVSEPRRYLQAELKDRFDPKRIDMFLDAAPKMVAFFSSHTALQFEDGNRVADIHGDQPGAVEGGRSVIAAPIHGRVLGPLLSKMRPPMWETAFLGMPIMAGKDLWAFLNATKSLRAMAYVGKRLAQHGWDYLRYRRAMRFCNGSALIARLAKSADDLGVEIRVSTPARELVEKGGRVMGAMVRSDQGDEYIHARKGVVLAAGGFAHDLKRRAALFPRLQQPQDHWPLPPQEVSGDGLNMAEKIGAMVSDDVASPAAWCPISRVPYPNGRVGHFPHIIDRAKPGVIAVLANGQRFVNEADGYHDFVAAMLAQVPEGEEVASWLICSHACQRRYGLGMSRPFPFSVKPWLASGYLKMGASMVDLARQCGIDAQALQVTLADYNHAAQQGQDPLFGRGTTPYNQKMGDPSHQPNPALAPIETGPFYAVKVVPGSFGTFAGLKTNEFAQVLHQSGQPIPGLYAAGVDMENVMMGHYPSGGINLGPAMTFGYVAGCHLAAQPI